MKGWELAFSLTLARTRCDSPCPPCFRKGEKRAKSVGAFFPPRLRGGGRRDNKNAGPLILIGLVIAAVGYGLALVIRLMLSRTREYVADAGSVDLTKNPDAMISALRKIEGHTTVKAPDEVQGMFLDNQPDREGIDSLFATHPSIEKRIAALIKYAGGRDLPPPDRLDGPDRPDGPNRPDRPDRPDRPAGPAGPA